MDITEKEIRESFDKLYESSITSFDGIQPITGEGYSGWKIKAGKSMLITNDVGLALFQKCVQEWVEKELSSIDKEQFNKDFVNDILYGKR